MVVCFSELPEGWGKITALIACTMKLKMEMAKTLLMASQKALLFMRQSP